MQIMIVKTKRLKAKSKKTYHALCCWSRAEQDIDANKRVGDVCVEGGVVVLVANPFGEEK